MEWEAVLVNFQEFDEVVILQAPRPVRTIREYRNRPANGIAGRFRLRTVRTTSRFPTAAEGDLRSLDDLLGLRPFESWSSDLRILVVSV